MSAQRPTRLPKLTTDGYASTSNSRPHEWNESPKSSSASSRNSSFLTTPHSSSNSHTGHYATTRHDYAQYLTYGPTHSQERAIKRHGPEPLGLSRKSAPFVKRQADDPSAGRVANTLTGVNTDSASAGNHAPGHEEGKHLYQEEHGSARGSLHKDVSNSIPFPKARCHSNVAPSSCRSPGLSRGSSSASRNRAKLGPHHFLVSRLIGKGGFGYVYEGIEVQSGHVVAIKTVSRQGLARHRVDSVLKEQVISRKVSENRNCLGASENGSEFVVRMVSSFLTPSHFVFVLEYHGAGDLRDVDFPLKTEYARFYIGEMALGLRYLHSQNIVLRDLKPANALLGFDGHVRLADFGLATISECSNNGAERTEFPVLELQSSSFGTRARSGSLRSVADALRLSNFGLVVGRKRSNTTAVIVPTEGNGNLTRSRSWGLGRGFGYKRPQQTVLCGTPGYISPEGYLGRHGPEGDVWALGITLFEFITGANPFDTWGEPTKEIWAKVQHEEPYYPEGMPKKTRSILEKLLRKKWKKRATLDEMMAHPFFNADGFSWERLQKKEINPPPLPQTACERLQRTHKVQSRGHDVARHPEMPLILYLEHESMAVTVGDTFREELSAEETAGFYINTIDSLPRCLEEKEGSGDESRVWWQN